MGLLSMLREAFRPRTRPGGIPAKCPKCSKPVDTGMARCPGCGTRLSAMFRLECPQCHAPNELNAGECAKCRTPLVPARPPEGPPAAPSYRCPFCGYVAHFYMLSCPSCGARFS